MHQSDRRLLSGNEAIALAAIDGNVTLGTGYPGTPSTEILERFSAAGGRGQWAPNEKVAMEVGVGVATAGATALVTMKHVGLNVAADVLFTVAYAGVDGALVVAVADDPGMSSSQNEQDSRHYALAAAAPMIEPSDSQEAYEFTLAAIEMSRRWKLPILLRLTTRVCHSKSIVVRRGLDGHAASTTFTRDIAQRVMIPAHARPAHRRLRRKLDEIREESKASSLNRIIPGNAGLGIITSGATFLHVREAAPEATVLKLGMIHPLAIEPIRAFAAGVERCLVIEEGDPYLADRILAAGVKIESRPEMYRFGELNVARVRRILSRDDTPEPAPPRGKPPQLCPGCSYRAVFQTLNRLDCIVAGDIGCYTLGALPPFSAMDTQLCMGASIGIGLGLRHALPDEQAARVVSVIGDSTFVHSGLTGLAEMVYNPPKTGHVLLILDNGTTAMTGQQEHPATGRTMGHEPTGRLDIEAIARTMVGVVDVIDPTADPVGFEQLLRRRLEQRRLAVIIARRPCLLAAADIRNYEKAAAGKTAESALACEALGAEIDA